LSISGVFFAEDPQESLRVLLVRGKAAGPAGSPGEPAGPDGPPGRLVPKEYDRFRHIFDILQEIYIRT